MSNSNPILLFAFVTNMAIACNDEQPYPDKMFPEVLITTSMGEIVVELDRNRAPITVNNFLRYIKSGSYINTIFHRVEKDFVVQGGGYNAKYDEVTVCNKTFNESGNGLQNKKGTIAMARYDDPHSATSQFYFNLEDNTSLDPNAKNWGYAVFGEVIEGMDVLSSMSKVSIGYSEKLRTGNVPIEPLIIQKISIN